MDFKEKLLCLRIIFEKVGGGVAWAEIREKRGCGWGRGHGPGTLQGLDLEEPLEGDGQCPCHKNESPACMRK